MLFADPVQGDPGPRRIGNIVVEVVPVIVHVPLNTESTPDTVTICPTLCLCATDVVKLATFDVSCL